LDVALIFLPHLPHKSISANPFIVVDSRGSLHDKNPFAHAR
jgi:hypothetical protein